MYNRVTNANDTYLTLEILSL